MGHMKVILSEDVYNLGKAGEVVRVRAGYGRNYLIPQGKALQASIRNIRQLEHQRGVLSARALKVSKEATAIAERIGSVVPTVTKRAGDGDRLFGSVTARDVAAALAVEGVEIDRRKLDLPSPVKKLGVYEIEVKLTSTITATTQLWVVSDEKSRAVLEREAAERQRQEEEAAKQAAERAEREATEAAKADAEEAEAGRVSEE